MTAPLALNLLLEGRPVLLVGGGSVASRKAEALVAAGARVTLVAPNVLPELEETVLANSGRVFRRGYRTGDGAGCAAFFVATGDERVSRQVAHDAERTGRWINVADRPDLCTFIPPAVVRRGPFQIAVSSSGRSPFLASWLRDRAAALLDSGDWQGMLLFVEQWRSLIRRMVEPVSRREDLWREARERGLADQLFAGARQQADGIMRDVLSGAEGHEQHQVHQVHREQVDV